MKKVIHWPDHAFSFVSYQEMITSDGRSLPKVWVVCHFNGSDIY